MANNVALQVVCQGLQNNFEDKKKPDYTLILPLIYPFLIESTILYHNLPIYPNQMHLHVELNKDRALNYLHWASR